MYRKILWCYFIILTLLDISLNSQLTAQGKSHGVSVHESLAEGLGFQEWGKDGSAEEGVLGGAGGAGGALRLSPAALALGPRPLGAAHAALVTLTNVGNTTLHLASVAGTTPDFHASFFDAKVYPATSESNNVLVEMPTTSGSNIITSEMPAPTSGGMDNVYEYHILQDTQSTNQHQCYSNLEQNLEILNAISSNQSQILNEIRNIKNVQNIMIQKVSLFSIQLDDAVSQITRATESNLRVTDLDESRSTPNNTFYIKPVGNIQQLNELEQKLSDSSVRQQMKKTYSVLCNEGKGIDCAYTLADILFSRDFLCQCTWSGGSRGSDTKIAWKSFKHILSFFWEMVHSWDKTYTVNENETFFKNILKNSKKRKLAKNQRASTSRKRSKLTKPEIPNDYETSDEDMSDESKDNSINKENPVAEKKKQDKDKEGQEKSNENNADSNNKENPITEKAKQEKDKEEEEKSNEGNANSNNNKNPVIEKAKQEKDQEVEKESDISEEIIFTENNSEEKDPEVEKERNINEENKVHSNNSSNDKESGINDENETKKEVKNLENITIDSKENEENVVISKEIEKNYNKKMAIDITKVTTSGKNKESTLNEPKNKSNDPSTSSNRNFHIEKNAPKKKVVRISKKMREKNRLLKIKKNRPISHKDVSG